MTEFKIPADIPNWRSQYDWQFRNITTGDGELAHPYDSGLEPKLIFTGHSTSLEIDPLKSRVDLSGDYIFQIQLVQNSPVPNKNPSARDLLWSWAQVVPTNGHKFAPTDFYAKGDYGLLVEMQPHSMNGISLYLPTGSPIDQILPLSTSLGPYQLLDQAKEHFFEVEMAKIFPKTVFSIKCLL